MLKRVAITGPESTGKTNLAAWLANIYKTVWVPEYAREYLEKNGPDYALEDVVAIAKEQLARENAAAENARKILICDTDLLVTKKYGAKLSLAPVRNGLNNSFICIATTCICFAIRTFPGSLTLCGKTRMTAGNFLRFTGRHWKKTTSLTG